MKAEEIINALDLPADALVHQRVPKKLLLENGAPTAAAKRLINEGIEELRWIASLKPTTVGIAAYRDPTREYLEIAVLQATLRSGAKAGRLIELIHRAIPYPVVLIVEIDQSISISLTHKRWSAGETGKTVVDGEPVAVESSLGDDSRVWGEFSKVLSLRYQPRSDLNALYQGWVDSLIALEIARITGTFVRSASPAAAEDSRIALREHANITAEIARLRAAAEGETQLAKRVELNLEINRLRANLRRLRKRFGGNAIDAR